MDSDIGALTIIFTEFYYWITVVIMFLIHIGFCMYEVGASRTKNMMHTLMKNTMLIPRVDPPAEEEERDGHQRPSCCSPGPPPRSSRAR